MNRALIVVTISIAAVLAVPRPAAVQTPSRADLLCRHGFDFIYNLDFADGLGVFQEAAAADPKDPQAYRAIATATWLQILFRRGVVTVDDYLGHVSASDQQTEAPPPADGARFHTNIDRALAIGEEAVRRNPNSASAHYDVGSAVGLLASYSATVEGRVLGGLRAARRAFNEQEQVLELDPRRKDAGLVVGTYRYIVASLPFPVRVMAYVVGFGGGRERGIQMIEQAAAYPGDSQVDAKFALVLIYNRERRYDEALKMIRDLRSRFPRNRLFWLEAGATALRAGRAQEAERELSEGIDKLQHDTRPRSLGEEALWYYKRGAARVLLGDYRGADADLRASLTAKGHEWVRGRARTEMGKLADVSGNHTQAVSEYQTAVSLCNKANDADCVQAAKALIGTPYRKKG